MAPQFQLEVLEQAESIRETAFKKKSSPFMKAAQNTSMFSFPRHIGHQFPAVHKRLEALSRLTLWSAPTAVHRLWVNIAHLLLSLTNSELKSDHANKDTLLCL